MNTHDLAKFLLDGPNCEITASVDVSTDDSNAYQRCFANEMVEVQWEPGNTATFLFTGGYDNNDK
ncbi:MAG: hypothetical protein QM500_12165 [Methylococcales bacterium]